VSYLQLININKGFNQTQILKDISLDFEEGEFISLLGPSGCGKTTLLNIIAGIQDSDSGKVMHNGIDITHTPAERRHFGVVFQNYALFPNLTVAENIAYGLHGSQWNKQAKQARVLELLQLVSLEAHGERYPSELSGGQQQRIALARALAPKPALLLLDEPLSALDAQVRASLGQEILRIQRSTKITTIMVTHDQQEALALADRVILMNQGGVEQAGSPDSLYSTPSSQFVAEFIGHMNIVELPHLNEGCPFGIRYEDVAVNIPSEVILQRPNTWVGKVEHNSLMGAFRRVRVLLNDFSTYIYADIPNNLFCEEFYEQKLVAVTLSQEYWRKWAL
jgi:iron(III) transport system ATP-binding protein